MAVKIGTQLANLTALLFELKSELQEARADIRWLKEQASRKHHPRPKRAVITLPESYEYPSPSISLTVEDWSRVKAGETVTLNGEGIEFEGEAKLADFWEFSGGIGGTVKVSVKFDGTDEFELACGERLEAEFIEEFDADR